MALAALLALFSIAASVHIPLLDWLFENPWSQGAAVVSASVLAAPFSLLIARLSAPLAAAVGFIYGIATAALASLLFGIIPIALLFSFIAWPLTIPAGVLWALMLWWRRRRPRRHHVTVLAYASLAIAAAALVTVRMNAPLTRGFADGTTCVRYPQEEIWWLDWSPDGQRLALGTGGMLSDPMIRILGWPSMETQRVLDGVGVEIFSLGLDREAIYVYDTSHLLGELPADEIETSLWRVSADDPPLRLAVLPRNEIIEVRWTERGPAGRSFGSPSRAGVWMWIETTADGTARLRPIPTEDAEAVGLPTHIDPLSGYNVPSDALFATVTDDGRYLVFPTFPFDDDDVTFAPRIVAQSTETGERVTLLSADAGTVVLSSQGVLAWTSAWPGGSVCIRDVSTQLDN